jgi:hypothetical protein
MKKSNSDELGSWEKHTKGIGSKLLQKFGFTGRLGAKETGIDKAIEVTVRPVNVGLGFGNLETEKVPRGFSVTPQITKRKKQTQPLPKKQKKSRVASDKDQFTRILEADLREGSIIAGRASFVDSDDDDIECESDLGSVDDGYFEKDVENRTSPFMFGSVSSAPAGSFAMTETAAGARSIMEKENCLRQLQAAACQLSEKRTLDKVKVESLLSISQTVAEMVAMIDKFSSSLPLESNSVDAVIDLYAFKDKIRSLFESHPKEFALFGLIDLMYPIIQTLVLFIFSTTGDHNASFFSSHVSKRFKLTFLEIWRFVSSVPGPLMKEIELVMLPMTLERILLPKLLAAIANDFNPIDHTYVLVEYLQLLKPYVLQEKLGEVLQVSLFPKLLTFVQKWSYSFRLNQFCVGPFQSVSLSGSDVIYFKGTETNFLFHQWILPLLPLLSSVDQSKQIINQLFPEIRKKIIEVVRQLNFTDLDWRHGHNLSTDDPSAYVNELHEKIRIYFHLVVDLISPWKDIFDHNSYSLVVVNYVIPKVLAYARLGCFVPSSDSYLLPYKNLLLLSSVLPSKYYHMTFIQYFFPQFVSELIRCLQSCLMSSSPERALQKLQELCNWYKCWRMLFPPVLFSFSGTGFQAVALAKHCVIMLESCLSRFLEFITAVERNNAVTESFVFKMEPEWSMYVEAVSSLTVSNMLRFTEKEKLGGLLLSSSTEVRADVSLKELVQKLSERLGVHFSMLSRSSGDKMVYRFGKESIYFEGNIIYHYKSFLKRWMPISFDELQGCKD